MTADFSMVGGGFISSHGGRQASSGASDHSAATPALGSPAPMGFFESIVAFAIEALPRGGCPDAIRARFGLTQNSYYSVLAYVLSRPDVNCDSSTRRHLLDLCAGHHGSH
ncbi:hypothetical protein [Gordonia sp. NPDC127522]|uniref:hypothetical protein n=1 Tax=Gordonia sp. NPDC127522 TaxID=3345390 RepID=UPI0036252F32